MTLLDLAFGFMKIGILGFGGGYAMIPLIQSEAARFGIGGAEFVDILAVSEMTPGPIGINTATYAGFRAFGLPGAFAATCSCVLPSFLIMLAAARLLHSLKGTARLTRFFAWLRPFFIGLIASSAFLMAGEIRLWADVRSLGIFIAAAVSAYCFKAHPIAVILLAGIVGFVVY